MKGKSFPNRAQRKKLYGYGDVVSPGRRSIGFCREKAYPLLPWATKEIFDTFEEGADHSVSGRIERYVQVSVDEDEWEAQRLFEEEGIPLPPEYAVPDEEEEDEEDEMEVPSTPQKNFLYSGMYLLSRKRQAERIAAYRRRLLYFEERMNRALSQHGADMALRMYRLTEKLDIALKEEIRRKSRRVRILCNKMDNPKRVKISQARRLIKRLCEILLASNRQRLKVQKGLQKEMEKHTRKLMQLPSYPHVPAGAEARSPMRRSGKARQTLSPDPLIETYTYDITIVVQGALTVSTTDKKHKEALLTGSYQARKVVHGGFTWLMIRLPVGTGTNEYGLTLGEWLQYASGNEVHAKVHISIPGETV